jgi:quinol monooxygenase YgiN
MYGLSVRFTCKDEAAAEGFDKLVAGTVSQIREHEAGTIVYAVHTVEGKPLERIFYELYRDRAAFEAHEEQEHTRRFLDARGQFLASSSVDRLALQVGKGTDG